MNANEHIPLGASILKYFLSLIPGDTEVFIKIGNNTLPVVCLTHDENKLILSPTSGGIDDWQVTKNTIDSLNELEVLRRCEMTDVSLC